MASEPRIVLLMLVLFAAAAVFSTFLASPGARPDFRTGRFTPISNPNDSQIVLEMGRFAVDAHNKEANATLEFQSVIEAWHHVVAGSIFRLVIVAKASGSAAEKYEAVVWDRPWLPLRNLTSFKPYPMM
ncbi:unnamed protein product [Cuscuta epithymum]|uniref:Cystatin domain-containing protein n=1 Tax=Cuscuta epithymum TaxID=186058 RepID=A0AAV0EQN4_9ASTE|nr:unnamed protein product [Cuscuta epithymum]